MNKREQITELLNCGWTLKLTMELEGGIELYSFVDPVRKDLVPLGYAWPRHKSRKRRLALKQARDSWRAKPKAEGRAE